MKPGEIITCKEKDFINANEGLETIMMRVSNLGDRPIQVGVICIFSKSTGHWNLIVK